MSPFKNKMPKDFTIANFGHPVSKSLLRSRVSVLDAIPSTFIILHGKKYRIEKWQRDYSHHTGHDHRKQIYLLVSVWNTMVPGGRVRGIMVSLTPMAGRFSLPYWTLS